MTKPTGLWNISFNIANYLLLSLITFACVYPFYYIFIYSISDPLEASRGLVFLPRGINFDNYKAMLKLPDIYSSFVISVLRAVIGTIVTVFSSSLFAYIVTKNELVWRKFFYRFVIISLYLNAGLIPWYLTMKNLGLKNNFLLYVLPGAIVGFYVILIKTFIEQLPAALEESAMIDGAGYFTIYRKIIFPLSLPIIATIAVFAAVGQWNSWQDNFFLVSDPKLQTIQLILYNYLNQVQSLANMSVQELNRGAAARILTPQSVQMTITMVVTIPILFVYPFMQKYFVKGIMLGAVKG
ncbi:carbohydrate ABC transporter permease [Paenibacillus sp. GCM10027626]|uniref:carbohydrate ABC transporter permease n=1 Tax=Paenibacillus sp. GCM10027626 TaxID=3273411 RepID=UPI00362ABBBA